LQGGKNYDTMVGRIGQGALLFSMEKARSAMKNMFRLWYGTAAELIRSFSLQLKIQTLYVAAGLFGKFCKASKI
jgi:hypothetical protein